MLPSFGISDQFAPFKQAHVDKIPIRSAREITSFLIILEMQVFLPSPDAIVRKIDHKITAQWRPVLAAPSAASLQH